MSNKLFQKEEANYRALYGKLFSGLLGQFGAHYVSEIEDAIQNSFLKSLKIWKQKSIPYNEENWLFIVARNDLLDQIKNKQKQNYSVSFELFEENQITDNGKDLRLQTIIFIASLSTIAPQAKVIFILKNIFGLNIAEIHGSTFLNQEAIYKSINRTKKNIQQEFNLNSVEIQSISANPNTVKTVEEILYSVFNIGFDSFIEKKEGIVNEDLCLEAFSLARVLFNQYQFDSTSNLLALFCFHSARIPSKIDSGKLIPFFKQNREKWNSELYQLGFNYLKKPETVNKFYIEAVIISKYMSKPIFILNDWNEIVELYEIMQRVSSSPIIKLNYCFCLSKIGKTEQALVILSEIKKELPNEHTYFNLVKAKLLKEVNPAESDRLFTLIMNNSSQKIRREYLLENELIHI
ncbi:DUF6596 domain-containing protein [Chryseobacterium indoltheticum]|uniref:DUF6596 domain-containing protein n=1 Tax=Chryseobacterium indoltheticum TaxID=254 RepID=UPI001911D4AA|nr:DUF6596 domain-containing protein [Chryseobacterium indoltheticum]QQQ29082.1 RNA polymerase [Chryseobacterium indoltheticum]